MSQIADYFVVQGDDKHEFEGAVKEMLKDGWEPLGGVAYQQGGDFEYGTMPDGTPQIPRSVVRRVYVQAMIRR